MSLRLVWVGVKVDAYPILQPQIQIDNQVGCVWTWGLSMSLEIIHIQKVMLFMSKAPDFLIIVFSLLYGFLIFITLSFIAVTQKALDGFEHVARYLEDNTLSRTISWRLMTIIQVILEGFEDILRVKSWPIVVIRPDLLYFTKDDQLEMHDMDD